VSRSPLLPWVLGSGLLLVSGASAWAGSWEEHRFDSGGRVPVVEVELYRGIVRFQARPPSEPVTLKVALVSYDDHRPGESIDASIRPLPKGALDLFSSPGRVQIEAPTLRDLVVVDLSAPAAAELRIHIVHYGEVTIEGALGEVEVDLFQGQVNLRDIRGPAVAHIVRDGTIRARLAPPVSDRAMALTTYEGDIVLEAPEQVAGRLQIASARGEIRNEFVTKAEGGPRAGEPILIRNAKGTIHVRPLH